MQVAHEPPACEPSLWKELSELTTSSPAASTSAHQLLAPAFAADDGSIDPALDAALRSLLAGSGSRVDVLRALASARVLVAVSARVTAVAPSSTSGLAADKEADMVLVTIGGRDGRRALPLFTSMAALQAWRGDLRPVAVEGARAARTALDDGAAALLLDPGSPTRLLVTGSELSDLAAVWAVGVKGLAGDEESRSARDRRAPVEPGGER